MARKGRPLSPEDQDLWQRVAKSATPLHPKARLPITQQVDPKPGQSKQVPSRFDPPAFEIGSKLGPGTTRDVAPAIADQLRSAPLKMDRKLHQRLKRGKTKPEARLDLHGMTLAEAQPALHRFIADSKARGLRLVLVITGKGRDRDAGGPIPTPVGVLRHQVPRWLSGPALGAMVQQVTPAHIRHGGEGALYVYLRR